MKKLLLLAVLLAVLTTINADTISGVNSVKTLVTSGNVGVGTSSPQQLLELSGTTPMLRINDTRTSVTTGDVLGGIEMYTNDGDGAHVAAFVKAIAASTFGRYGALSFGVSQTADTDAVGAMQINDLGNVIINNGTLAISALTSTDPLATNGSGVIIAGTSDRRLKQNIADITYGLNTILQLKPVSFQWKKNSEMDKQKGKKDEDRLAQQTKLGFIAQDVENIIPEAVGERKQNGLDDCKTFSKGAIIPVLVKAIQEQNVIINELKTRIEALENK